MNKNKKASENEEINENEDTSEENNEENNEETKEKSIEKIKEMGSVVTDNGKHKIHCLTIIGQIEGHYILPSQNKTTKYEHLIPQLVAIEEDNEIAGLLILLNTVGGDVEAGLALAELVSGMTKPTVSLVLGGGHSIAVPLAVAAKRSFISPSATMTIHPVRMSGMTIGVPQTFEHFRRMQDRITRFVINNSNIAYDRFMELAMNTNELVADVGTILDGEHAVNEGLINEVGSLSQAISCLYEMIDNIKNEN